MSLLIDKTSQAYASLKGNDQERIDAMTLAIGFLLGAELYESAAAVILAQEELFPDRTRADAVNRIIKSGQRLHERQPHLSQREKDVLQDYLDTHPGISAPRDIDDEIPF
jgi:hypothetical protein